MHPVLVKNEDATKTKVASGKTLNDLAKEKGLPDWNAIALYNWGTDNPVEVNRLLFEFIGWEKSDADPGKTVLKPHANADREILLPTRWKKDASLDLDKTHTIKVKKQPDPPVAVTIDTLSRWFIPGKEDCALNYSLEGLKKNAEKVQLDVYGSNYCTAGDWNDGFVKFNNAADLKETKLYENTEQASAPERAKGTSIKEWKGKVTATAGALGKKNPGGGDRVLNAAFSPYTAVVRYSKDDADKTARIDLDAFWPQFDNSGNAVADSLKIRFAIRKTGRIASTNGGGTLLVYDRNFDIVYREPISLAHLGQKDADFHEIAWNGAYSPHTKNNSAGTTKAIAADMPYRVQIQVHTGVNEPKGLALAAMSTEVRIYVHPQTHVLSLNPYVATTDKPSFAFRSDRDLLAVKDPIARGDGALWIRHQLARTGFHPGPVENPVAAAYQSGLLEFKRSLPKRKAKASDPEKRFALDTSEGADVLDAIEDLEAQGVRHRPWWGDPTASRADFTLSGTSASNRLNDASKEIIVWVDDRHYYTDADWMINAGPKGTATRTKLINDPAGMGNYALTYTSGDAVIDGKATWIPRPWVPISVTPVLLSKGQQLTDIVAAPSNHDLNDMAKAIGPLRIDWSFDEIDADPCVEAIVDAGMYHKDVSRPKLAIEFARNQKKSAGHARKDVSKTSIYSNCPANCGGIRPAATADYYKVAYAQQAESLKPWRAEPDAAFETISTIIHDNVGQADDKIFPKRFGAAGVYFRPSTIGGDGMRLRAQMRFKPVGDYKFANLATLEKRYALLPQVQSSAIRTWRKGSLRGYISWGPNNSWGTHNAGLRKHFDAAYLHLVYEKNDAAISQAVTHYFSNNSAFRDLVKEAVNTTGSASAGDKERAKNSNIALHPQRLWPWYGAEHFGIFEASNPNSNRDDAVDKFYKLFSSYFYSLSNLYGLAWVKDVEAKTGKMRGHIVVEFQAGDDFFVQQYECQNCAVKFWYVEKNATGDSMVKEKCPSACGGRLKRVLDMKGHYTCTNGHKGAWAEAAVGGSFHGFLHNGGGCGGTWNADQVTRIKYVCNKCGWTFNFSDPTGTTFVGATCYDGTCDGKLHRPGGDAGLFTEVYTCNKCAVDVTMNEVSVAGGSHVGETHKGCAKIISGKLARKAPAVVTPIPQGNRVELTKAGPSYYTGIPVPSIGNPLGVSLNTKADAELWAHELAHNRYMEHAANAGSANNAQHDHQGNTHFNFAGINETVATVQGWDRACLMTYVTHLATYSAARDKRVMCGKCFLKVRGWKLQVAGAAVPDAPGGSHE
ncbi:MAG TPA: hypothetical protein VER03_14330 [Bryobacteraceae bacterium]|nr:hypothetical protein [Bryobacteraceae bacterium]